MNVLVRVTVDSEMEIYKQEWQDFYEIMLRQEAEVAEVLELRGVDIRSAPALALALEGVF